MRLGFARGARKSGEFTVAFYDDVVGTVRGIYDRRIHTPAVLDAAQYFPAATRFTAAWQDIRREALAVAETLPRVPRFQDLMPEQEDIAGADGRDWRVFIMKAYGVSVPSNLARAPTVAALLDQTPEAVSAIFAFLAPGKHIPAHRGPFRAILRFHLMLSMPNDENGVPACELNIDGVPYKLADGESLLWDDTYPHEVWNRSERVRIALLLDVWRRDMPTDIALMSRLFMGGIQLWLKTKGVRYVG
jgi:aspartate beta-hydroxylase